MGKILAAVAVLLFLGAAGGPARAAEYRLLRIDGLNLKWGQPSLGAGAAVTYAFATRDERFDDAINCRSLAPMDVLRSAWGGDPAGLARVAAEAFAMWSAAAGVDFRPAAQDERADILIGAQGAPRGVAFANVWWDAAAARGGVAPLSRATICLNPDVAFTQGAARTADGYDLVTALAHEIGHAIGLDHPGAAGALMGFQNQGPMDRLRPGDAAGAVALYGLRRGS